MLDAWQLSVEEKNLYNVVAPTHFFPVKHSDPGTRTFLDQMLLLWIYGISRAVDFVNECSGFYFYKAKHIVLSADDIYLSAMRVLEVAAQNLPPVSLKPKRGHLLADVPNFLRRPLSTLIVRSERFAERPGRTNGDVSRKVRA